MPTRIVAPARKQDAQAQLGLSRRKLQEGRYILEAKGVAADNVAGLTVRLMNDSETMMCTGAHLLETVGVAAHSVAGVLGVCDGQGHLSSLMRDNAALHTRACLVSTAHVSCYTLAVVLDICRTLRSSMHQQQGMCVIQPYLHAP